MACPPRCLGSRGFGLLADFGEEGGREGELGAGRVGVEGKGRPLPIGCQELGWRAPRLLRSVVPPPSDWPSACLLGSQVPFWGRDWSSDPECGLRVRSGYPCGLDRPCGPDIGFDFLQSPAIGARPSREDAHLDTNWVVSEEAVG